MKNYWLKRNTRSERIRNLNEILKNYDGEDDRVVWFQATKHIDLTGIEIGQIWNSIHGGPWWVAVPAEEFGIPLSGFKEIERRVKCL